MKIPKSFQLAGAKWTVEKRPKLGDLGLTHRDDFLIQLGSEQSKISKEITFCHELVHAIKYTMGIDNHNEQEVDAFAQLLHQVWTSMK